MDDFTYSPIGSVNNPEVQTPNQDLLVNRGTMFTQAFNEGLWSGAVRLPARSMLITGLHLWHTRRVHPHYNNISLWGKRWQVMDIIFTGKWHLGGSSVRRCAQHIGPYTGNFGRGMLTSSGNDYSSPHKVDQKIELSEIPNYVTAHLTSDWEKT